MLLAGAGWLLWELWNAIEPTPITDDFLKLLDYSFGRDWRNPATWPWARVMWAYGFAAIGATLTVGAGLLVLTFAAIYVFNSTGSGTASTWVLWEKNMTMNAGGTMTTWEPLDGFDRLSDCHQSAREIIREARAFMNGGGRKLVAVRPDGRSAVYTLS